MRKLDWAMACSFFEQHPDAKAGRCEGKIAA